MGLLYLHNINDDSPGIIVLYDQINIFDANIGCFSFIQLQRYHFIPCVITEGPQETQEDLYKNAC